MANFNFNNLGGSCLEPEVLGSAKSRDARRWNRYINRIKAAKVGITGNSYSNVIQYVKTLQELKGPISRFGRKTPELRQQMIKGIDTLINKAGDVWGRNLRDLLAPTKKTMVSKNPAVVATGMSEAEAIKTGMLNSIQDPQVKSSKGVKSGIEYATLLLARFRATLKSNVDKNRELEEKALHTKAKASGELEAMINAGMIQDAQGNVIKPNENFNLAVPIAIGASALGLLLIAKG